MLVRLSKTSLLYVGAQAKRFVKLVKLADLSGEKMTLGQRIALGQASDSNSDSKVLKTVVKKLFGIDIQPKHFKHFIDYAKQVGESLAFWLAQEKSLHYQPTPEELRAGIEELGKKLQHFGTIDAIAKRMTISHNEAIRLPYSTVFLMLKSDLEHAMFERRLSKLHQQKAKNKK